jgi:hypothetical protein
MLARTGEGNNASRPCLPLAARAIATRDTLRRDQKLPGRLMRSPLAWKLLICTAVVVARPNLRARCRQAIDSRTAIVTLTVAVAVECFRRRQTQNPPRFGCTPAAATLVCHLTKRIGSAMHAVVGCPT